jgi:hypothetical protein
MNKRIFSSTVGALVCAAVITLSAQTTSKTIRIIGCVQRASTSAYILKDIRADDSYRLDGNADDLDFHAGHFVEVIGSLTDTTTNPPRLKISSVIYLSRTCPAAAKK